MENKINFKAIARQSHGQVANICTSLGISVKAKTHQKCPICGGDDRFYLDDKSPQIAYFCRHCGYGDIINLVSKALDINAYDAAKRINSNINVDIPSTSNKKITRQATGNKKSISKGKAFFIKTLNQIERQTPTQDALNYFKSRGINFMNNKKIDAITYGLTTYKVNDLIAKDSNDKYLRNESMLCKLTKHNESLQKPTAIHVTHFKNIDGNKRKNIHNTSSTTSAGTGIWFTSKRMKELHVVEGLENALCTAKVLKTRAIVVAVNANYMKILDIPDFIKVVNIWCDNDVKVGSNKNAGLDAARYLERRLLAKNKKVKVIIPNALLVQPNTPPQR